MIKKTLALLLAGTLAMSMLTGCGSKDTKDTKKTTEATKADDKAAADKVAKLIENR